MRAAIVAAGGLLVAAAASATAQPGTDWPGISYGDGPPGYVAAPYSPGVPPFGPYFYPEGYDPQYGSGGRLPDAADYGCRLIWNARTGTRVPACNPPRVMPD